MKGREITRKLFKMCDVLVAWLYITKCVYCIHGCPPSPYSLLNEAVTWFRTNFISGKLTVTCPQSYNECQLLATPRYVDWLVSLQSFSTPVGGARSFATWYILHAANNLIGHQEDWNSRCIRRMAEWYAIKTEWTCQHMPAWKQPRWHKLLVKPAIINKLHVLGFVFWLCTLHFILKPRALVSTRYLCIALWSGLDSNENSYVYVQGVGISCSVSQFSILFA